MNCQNTIPLKSILFEDTAMAYNTPSEAAFGAIQNGAKSIAPIFLEAVLKGDPAAVHWRNENGRTMLMEAALNGRTPLVEILLRYGADTEAQDRIGMNALMYAAIRGHDANVNALLDAGANINAKTADGATALDCAALTNRKKTVLLLQARAAQASPSTSAAPRPPRL